VGDEAERIGHRQERADRGEDRHGVWLPSQSVWEASSSIISLDRNPLNNGMPAIDSAATVPMRKVIGIRCLSPPKPFDVAGMRLVIDDARRHEKRGLERQVVDDVKDGGDRSGLGAEAQSIVKRPRWLTVENANSAFRSSLNSAISAPSTIVTRPVVATM
jgi:hypothetical protein